jgi:hypothetical protein
MFWVLPLVYIWILIIKVIRFRRYKKEGGIRSKDFWLKSEEAFVDLEPGEIAGMILGSVAVVGLLVVFAAGQYYKRKY